MKNQRLTIIQRSKSCRKSAVMAAILLFLILLGPVGCVGAEFKEKYQVTFAMDTVLELRIYGENAQEALSSCTSIAGELDVLLSTQNNESIVHKINTANEPITIPPEVSYLLEVSDEVSSRSDGAFDVTIYPLVLSWGFTTEEYRIPSAKELENAHNLVGYEKINLENDILTLPEGVMLDFGGIAKGYATDRMKQILEEKEVKSAIISFGGNVLAYGTKPGGKAWKVGVQDPADANSLAAILSVKDSFVITSGGYQRYFERDDIRYHHIIDPATGYPAKSGLISVTIVCDDGTRADALSTALFVLGEEAALKYYDNYGGFEVLLINEKGELIITQGLKDHASSINTEKYTVRYHE